MKTSEYLSWAKKVAGVREPFLNRLRRAAGWPETPEDIAEPEMPAVPKQAVQSSTGGLMQRRRAVREPENPFSIPKSRKPMQIGSRRDLDDILHRIQNTSDMQEFVERYRYRYTVKDSQTGNLNVLERLIKEANGEKFGSLYVNKCSAQKLAGMIRDKILQRAVNLYSGLYTIYNKEDGLKDEFHKEMVETVNQYLQQIGVYTCIPRLGDTYDENLACLFKNRGERKTQKNDPPRIVAIDRPAYQLDYLDEEGEFFYVMQEGVCDFE